MRIMINTVPYYSCEIPVFKMSGTMYFAPKTIVRSMGLSWPNQLRIIRNDPVLNSVKMLVTLIDTFGTKHEVTALPLDYLSGWLFKIPASRYSGDVKDTVLLFQRECYKSVVSMLSSSGIPSTTTRMRECSRTVVTQRLDGVEQTEKLEPLFPDRVKKACNSDGDQHPALPSLNTVAHEMKMCVKALFQLLHRKKVLYRRRGGVKYNGYLYYVFDQFIGKGLFSPDVKYDGKLKNGPKSSCLKITHKGKEFIKALLKSPNTKTKDVFNELYSRNK